MKSDFFRPDTIRKKAAEMRRRLGGYARDFRETFNPDNAALLVIDMQKYFLDPASHAFLPAAPAIVPGINDLIAEFVAKSRPVIFTRHINTRRDAGSLDRWWADVITAGNPLSKIIDDFNTRSGVVLKKSQYDAFYNTELESVLRDRKIRQVVITGVMTHLCCETTARAAFVHGFDVFFAIDGTATHDEACHLSTLRNLAHGFAAPFTAAEMIEFLQEHHES